MIRLGHCFCPKCGKEHDGSGRLGTSQQCSCGVWIPHKTLDRVRYYWIIQIALAFGLAAFFFALAVFFRDLPKDPWGRFFSPLLQVPAITAFISSYRSLIRHKRTKDSDVLFRYFFWGIGLMTVGIAAASLVAILVKSSMLIH